jgi:hypothetical protein
MENLDLEKTHWIDALAFLSVPICIFACLGAIQLAIEFARGFDRGAERLGVSIVSLTASLFVALASIIRRRQRRKQVS